jgi:hypothetical protein
MCILTTYFAAFSAQFSRFFLLLEKRCFFVLQWAQADGSAAGQAAPKFARKDGRNMKTVKVQPLTIEAFAPFGTYTNILEPKGDSLGGPFHTFYRDSSRWFCESSLPVGLSPLVVKKQEMKKVMLLECLYAIQNQVQSRLKMVKP